jgi:hypothetical protein
MDGAPGALNGVELGRQRGRARARQAERRAAWRGAAGAQHLEQVFEFVVRVEGDALAVPIAARARLRFEAHLRHQHALAADQVHRPAMLGLEAPDVGGQRGEERGQRHGPGEGEKAKLAVRHAGRNCGRSCRARQL